MVVQYKFSTAENMKAQGGFDDNACQEFGGKTSRWIVDPSKSFQEQVYSRSNIYGADNADHTCADSLTNFINWAAKVCPAKKYMLIVHDHGGGYTPNDDLPESVGANTRGLVYDDGRNNKHFTVKSFTRAIRQADVHIETLFMDACLMNCLQNRKAAESIPQPFSIAPPPIAFLHIALMRIWLMSMPPPQTFLYISIPLPPN